MIAACSISMIIYSGRLFLYRVLRRGRNNTQRITLHSIKVKIGLSICVEVNRLLSIDYIIAYNVNYRKQVGR